MRLTKPFKLFLIAGVCTMCLSTANAQNSEAEFSTVLEQISNTKISIAQHEAFVAAQEGELASLQSQIEGLDEVKAAIPAIIEKMSAAIEREVAADYPFDIDNRQARIRALRDTVKSPTATPTEKYRKALSAYKIEVNFGASIESYPGDHPTSPTLREGDDRYAKDEDGKILLDKQTGLPVPLFDGDYIRYGRASFAYMNKDGSGALRYDLKAREWVAMGGDDALQVRRGIRVAKGEIAPNVVYAPVIPDT